MRFQISCVVSMLAVALHSGCAPELGAGRDDASKDAAVDAGDGELEVSGKFTHRVQSDGSVLSVVDATDGMIWQYLDLDTRAADAAEARWDLAVLRFRIRSNGGASGKGGVQVAALEGADFAALDRAPEAGFAADRPDTDEDTDSEPDNVFNSGDEDWYAYDDRTHVLSPREVAYVVASTEARFYKLRIEDYYDAAGTPAMLKFRWAEIAPPANGWSGADDDAGMEEDRPSGQ